MVQVEVRQLGHRHRLFAQVDHGVVAQVQPRDLTKSMWREEESELESPPIHGHHRTTLVPAPAHGLSGEELQLVVVQAETAEREESSKRLVGQIVEGVVAETKPLYVVQALEDMLYTQMMVERYRPQNNKGAEN